MSDKTDCCKIRAAGADMIEIANWLALDSRGNAEIHNGAMVDGLQKLQ